MTRRPAESDPMLRRFERNQVLAALCLAVAAVAVSRRLDVLVGVICGAALMAVSYRAIKGGVDLLMPGTNPAQPPNAAAAGPAIEIDAPKGADEGHRRRTRGWMLAVRFVGRYALLALAAYVMLAYLRAHPVGLLLGVASPVVAMAVEAARFIRRSSRPGHSR
jgi:hypothetical protein